MEPKLLMPFLINLKLKANDLSCTNQNVGENRIITLLTCNNINGKRTIIKAKEYTE